MRSIFIDGQAGYPSLLFIFLLIAAGFAGRKFSETLPTGERVDRFMAGLLPILIVTIGFLFVYKVLWAAYDEHNWVRLKNAFIIAFGYPLYYLPEEGPALTTIYGPVSALAYWPATLTNHPLLAISIASVLTLVFIFAPALWIHVDRSIKEKRFALSLFTFSFFCFGAFLANSLKESAFNIHADAPAIGLGALACGFLYHRKSSQNQFSLFLSALFAVLAVWAKQVAVPLLIVLPLYLLLVNGKAIFQRYAVYLFLLGSALTILFALIFDFQAMFFHILTLPAQHDLKSPVPGELLEAVLTLLLDLVILSPLALLPVYLFFTRENQFRFAAWLRLNPWFLFMLVALAMIPIAVLSYAKVGGSLNTLSFAVYYWLLGVTLCWRDYLGKSAPAASDSRKVRGRAGAAAIAVALVFLAIHIPVGFFRIFAFPPGDNFALRAYSYIQKNPGETYFPRLTLLHLLAEGKLYHSLEGLIDRSWGETPLTQEHFLKYIPKSLKVLGFSRENYRNELPLTGFNVGHTNVDELPGFTVYLNE